MLGEEDISFSVYVRVSEVCKWPERVKLLKQAGCTCVIIGIETLDDKILAATNKKIVANDTKLALDILRKYGLEVQGCLMLGFPEGGISDAIKTIDFALAQNLNCYRWHVYMPNYSQLPRGMITPKEVSLLDYKNIQIDAPDHLLYPKLVSGPSMGLLDEHALVRSLPYLPEDISVLDQFRHDGFSYKDLVGVMREKILPEERPLNEDEMYDLLFESGRKHQIDGPLLKARQN